MRRRVVGTGTGIGMGAFRDTDLICSVVTPAPGKVEFKAWEETDNHFKYLGLKNLIPKMPSP